MFFAVLYREINCFFPYKYNIQPKIFHISDFRLRCLNYGAFAANLW